MKSFRYSFGLFAIVLEICAITKPITGVDFTFSTEKVLLGSTGTLAMICDITETDVDRIYLIQIRRIKSTTLSGSHPNDWQTLALMEYGKNESPTLTQDIHAIAASKDYVAGGSWDSDTPASTVLTLSMNMEKLVCNDARYYRCDLIYKSSITQTGVKRNATFSVYVKPQVTSLVVRKNGIIVEGMSPSNMATAEVGDELELTCTANIGSLPGTHIRWHRTSETSPTNDFIGYQAPQGTYDEGTAASDNQCGYTRVATTRYNTTAADANRDNNLAFECYVTVNGDPYGNSYTSENNPRFYTDVTGSGGGQTDNSISTTAKPGDGMTTNTMVTTECLHGTFGPNCKWPCSCNNSNNSINDSCNRYTGQCACKSGWTGRTCDKANLDNGERGDTMSTTADLDDREQGNIMSTTGRNENGVGDVAVIGSVIAALAIGLIIGVICAWFILSRKGMAKDSRKQNQPQPTVSQEFIEPPLTSNIYEQLQNRTDTENRETYESLDTTASFVPNSQPQYESLEHGAETFHIYTDLKNSQ